MKVVSNFGFLLLASTAAGPGPVTGRMINEANDPALKKQLQPWAPFKELIHNKLTDVASNRKTLEKWLKEEYVVLTLKKVGKMLEEEEKVAKNEKLDWLISHAKEVVEVRKYVQTQAKRWTERCEYFLEEANLWKRASDQKLLEKEFKDVLLEIQKQKDTNLLVKRDLLTTVDKLRAELDLKLVGLVPEPQAQMVKSELQRWPKLENEIREHWEAAEGLRLRLKKDVRDLVDQGKEWYRDEAVREDVEWLLEHVAREKLTVPKELKRLTKLCREVAFEEAEKHQEGQGQFQGKTAVKFKAVLLEIKQQEEKNDQVEEELLAELNEWRDELGLILVGLVPEPQAQMVNHSKLPFRQRQLQRQRQQEQKRRKLQQAKWNLVADSKQWSADLQFKLNKKFPAQQLQQQEKLSEQASENLQSENSEEEEQEEEQQGKSYMARFCDTLKWIVSPVYRLF